MKTVNQWCKEFEEKNSRLATFDDFFNQSNKIAINLEAKEITKLQDKLHRRNMQIKELQRNKCIDFKTCKCFRDYTHKI